MSELYNAVKLLWVNEQTGRQDALIPVELSDAEINCIRDLVHATSGDIKYMNASMGLTRDLWNGGVVAGGWSETLAQLQPHQVAIRVAVQWNVSREYYLVAMLMVSGGRVRGRTLQKCSELDTTKLNAELIAAVVADMPVPMRVVAATSAIFVIEPDF